jgi:DNA recombination protein RmuC
MTSFEFWLVALALVTNLLLLVWLALRKAPESGRAELLVGIAASNEKTERELRREILDNGRANRQELGATFATFQQTLLQQSLGAIAAQNAQIDAFGQQLAVLQKTLSDTLTTQLQSVSESNARRMGEVRETLEKQLAQLQATNSAKLDEMRKTVDEKLQTTLETRLGESFKQVADRLEQVHRGLGEMQTLAQGVGDLKHLLTNVKTRGIFGEAQLAALLEQVFTVDQYAAQVATQPGSKNLVDFAIKLPGRADSGEPPTKTTSACSTPNNVQTCWVQKPLARRLKHAFASRPGPSVKNTSRRRTPPTLPFCFCPPRACMPKYCAAQG